MQSIFIYQGKTDIFDYIIVKNNYYFYTSNFFNFKHIYSNNYKNLIKIKIFPIDIGIILLKLYAYKFI